jgi:hypothetical protein
MESLQKLKKKLQNSNLKQGHLPKKKDTKKTNTPHQEMKNIPKKINILMINIHPLKEEEIQETDLIHRGEVLIQDIEEGTQEKDIKEEEMTKDTTIEDIKLFHFVKSNSIDFFFLNSFFTDLFVDSMKFNFLFFLYLVILLMTFQILFLHFMQRIKEIQEREKRINKKTPNMETRNICCQVC